MKEEQERLHIYTLTAISALADRLRLSGRTRVDDAYNKALDDVKASISTAIMKRVSDDLAKATVVR